mgnify:CR=1 FL=1
MIQIIQTNEVVDITTGTTGIQNIIRVCYELLYTNKLDNPEAINKFPDMCNLSRLNNKEIENLNPSDKKQPPEGNRETSFH